MTGERSPRVETVNGTEALTGAGETEVLIVIAEETEVATAAETETAVLIVEEETEVQIVEVGGIGIITHTNPAIAVQIDRDVTATEVGNVALIAADATAVLFERKEKSLQ